MHDTGPSAVLKLAYLKTAELHIGINSTGMLEDAQGSCAMDNIPDFRESDV